MSRIKDLVSYTAELPEGGPAGGHAGHHAQVGANRLARAVGLATADRGRRDPPLHRHLTRGGSPRRRKPVCFRLAGRFGLRALSGPGQGMGEPCRIRRFRRVRRSSMSRLTTKEITASARKCGIDPRVYLDGTRAGRNRLELAIRHRCEVLEALQRGETVPAVALAACPDLKRGSL